MSETTEGEKTKAVAICDGCGEITPVRVWDDGHIHPIGEDEGRCCDDSEYQVLEHESAEAFE